MRRRDSARSGSERDRAAPLRIRYRNTGGIGVAELNPADAFVTESLAALDARSLRLPTRP